MEIDIRDQFVSVSDGTFMFLSKNDINVITQKNKNSMREHNFYTVNKTGQEILERISGVQTANQLSVDFCSEKNIEHAENNGWINDFILQMTSYGALKLGDHPKFHEKIRIAGKDTEISPLSVTVEITDRCNLRCKHCYLEASADKERMMTIEQFRQLVSILKENHVVNIELTGGEIFVNPDILEILELSFDNFAVVALLTNGTIMNDQILNLLHEHKERTVMNVSIDSVHESVHDDFRGLKGAFKVTCENIKKLTKNGLTVRMASCIFPDNMWEIDKLADLSRKLGAKQFAFNHIEGFGRGADFELNSAKNDKATLKYVSYINEIINANKDIIPIINEDDFLIGTSNCGAGVKKVVIEPDGTLRPCALYPHTKVFGNIFEQDYKEIFRQSIYSDLSEVPAPGSDKGCNIKCKYIHHCKGCYVKALEHNTEFEEPCDWVVENQLEWLLKLYRREPNHV